MKHKAIVVFILGLFLFATMATAGMKELDKKVKKVCDEVEKKTSKGEAKELGCPRPSGGGSFYLAKGKKFANLVSEIDGKGFGTPLVVSPTRPVKLYYSSTTKGAIESLTVTSETFQRGTVHLKQGKPTQGVLGFELLSDLDNVTYTIIVTVPKEDNVQIEGATKLEGRSPKLDRYSITTKTTGLYLIR